MNNVIDGKLDVHGAIITATASGQKLRLGWVNHGPLNKTSTTSFPNGRLHRLGSLNSSAKAQARRASASSHSNSAIACSAVGPPPSEETESFDDSHTRQLADSLQMDKLSILCLSSDTGGGHRASAQALYDVVSPSTEMNFLSTPSTCGRIIHLGLSATCRRVISFL